MERKDIVLAIVTTLICQLSVPEIRTMSLTKFCDKMDEVAGSLNCDLSTKEKNEVINHTIKRVFKR